MISLQKGASIHTCQDLHLVPGDLGHSKAHSWTQGGTPWVAAWDGGKAPLKSAQPQLSAGSGATSAAVSPTPPVPAERDLLREPRWAPLPATGQLRRESASVLPSGSLEPAWCCWYTFDYRITLHPGLGLHTWACFSGHTPFQQPGYAAC